MKPEDTKGLGEESAAFRKLNPHLNTNPFGDVMKPNVLQLGGASVVTYPAKVLADACLQPTSDESRLNKAERAFLSHLRRLYRDDQINIAGHSLKLGDDCRYVPDFTVAPDENGCVVFYDVKSRWGKSTKPHIEDDSLVKLKSCARKYRWAKFVVTWKNAAGSWESMTMNP